MKVCSVLNSNSKSLISAWQNSQDKVLLSASALAARSCAFDCEEISRTVIPKNNNRAPVAFPLSIFEGRETHLVLDCRSKITDVYILRLTEPTVAESIGIGNGFYASDYDDTKPPPQHRTSFPSCGGLFL